MTIESTYCYYLFAIETEPVLTLVNLIEYLSAVLSDAILYSSNYLS